MSIQALTYLIGTFTRKSAALIQDPNVRQIDITALLLGGHLAAINRVMLSGSHDYQPIKELEMVCLVCKKASESEAEMYCYVFWHYLYSQSQKLISALKKNNPELAADYEEKFKLFQGKLFQRILVEEDVKSSVICRLDSLEMPDECRDGLKSIETGKPSEAQLKAVIHFFITEYSHGKDPMIELLGEALANVDDKHQASLIILGVYQEIDASIGRYYDSRKNKMLLGFADLVQCLEGLLPKVEIVRLMQDTNFTVKDPHRAENDMAYNQFCIQRNIYLGELDLSQLDEEYFYSPSIVGWVAASLLSDTVMVVDAESVTHLLQSSIPPLMMAACRQSPALIEACEQLYQTFIKVNERAGSRDQQHYRDPDLFFMTHQAAITQMIMLFGVSGIHILKRQLAETVLGLERYCENLAILDYHFVDPLRAYFDRYQISISGAHSQYKTCHNLILVLSTLLDIQNKMLQTLDERNAFTTKLLQDMKNNAPDDYLKIVSKQLLKIMLIGHEVDLESLDINQIFERIPREKFIQLVAASLQMQESVYKDVFSKLLYLDLTGGNVSLFLHDVEQTYELGGQLAQHNQRIQEKLRAQGIDPERALNYGEYRDLIIYPGGREGARIDNALSVLWSYCQSFETPLQEKIDVISMVPVESLHSNDKKTLERCLAIKRNLYQIRRKVEAASGSLTQAQAKADLCSHFDKIEKNLRVFQDAHVRNPADNHFSASFMEFLCHIRSQYAEVKAILASSVKPVSGKNQPLSIRVMQWDKCNPMTFFLGDEVGCCLGSTSPQFPAMVQRRMDDSMLFHVAVDFKTQKTVALIWLYLAERRDGDIVLIANFFEVNTKYALDDATRQALLNELCAFTHDYCSDNDIKYFYMNIPTYGWNMNDLHEYPVIDLDLKDKLGGAFVVDCDEFLSQAGEGHSDSELTCHHYYLASLDKWNTKFYHFVPDILKRKQDAIPNAVPVEALLEREIKSFISKSGERALRPHHIVTHLLRQHGLELAPFVDSASAGDQYLLTLFNKVSIKIGLVIYADSHESDALSQSGLFSLRQRELGALYSQRHDSPKAQKEFDEKFGLVVYHK